MMITLVTVRKILCFLFIITPDDVPNEKTIMFSDYDDTMITPVGDDYITGIVIIIHAFTTMKAEIYTVVKNLVMCSLGLEKIEEKKKREKKNPQTQR